MYILHLALKTTEGDISCIYQNAPNGAIILNCGMQEVITNVITHTKFFVNHFRGFGVLTPQNVAISIGLAGQSYNSISSVVLHCDTKIKDILFS